MKSNPIKEKTLKFAIKTLDFCKHLDKHRQFVVSNQLKRSGTSIGAQVYEAENAQSKADFIHKLSIAQKEANETIYWIHIVDHLKIIDKIIFQDYVMNVNEIKATLTVILKKLKTNNP